MDSLHAPLVHVRDLPSLRDEYLNWMNRPERREWYRAMGAEHGWAGRRSSPEISDRFYDFERGTIRIAELFYVNSEMTAVAEVAGRSLPSFTLAREDLPAERGLLVFDRPIGEWDEDGDGEWVRTVSVVGCSWWIADESVYITFYSWRDLNLASAVRSGSLPESEAAAIAAVQPHLVHDNELRIPLGEEHDFSPYAGTILDSWGRTVLAAWLLMQQPGVSARAPYRYSQMDRKWLKRRRLSQSEITVIRLRYATTPQGGGHGSGREYHHRWMVRGHWRKQWYPSRGSHVPIWISPHIKGPEGAPIKTGERVQAWVR